MKTGKGKNIFRDLLDRINQGGKRTFSIMVGGTEELNVQFINTTMVNGHETWILINTDLFDQLDNYVTYRIDLRDLVNYRKDFLISKNLVEQVGNDLILINDIDY